MRNISIQLVKKKICMESDPTFGGASSRIIAYISLELEDGIIIDEISVRQDSENHTDIRVIFPYRKVHDEIIPYITFSTEEAKQNLTKDILSKVIKAMENVLESQDKNNMVISR